VDHLHHLGVNAVRLSAYGMKAPLTGVHKLGDPAHPLAHTNTFDIGLNINSGFIALFSLVCCSLYQHQS